MTGWGRRLRQGAGRLRPLVLPSGVRAMFRGVARDRVPDQVHEAIAMTMFGHGAHGYGIKP